MAQLSLYRRYRPARFGEIRGQEHVVRALRNAVATDTAGQAYLFSGPRGTGKTTTARILAKVLNCTDVRDGEPCGVCDSCVAMDAGSSLDLFEIDAASNSRVDDMRDLISRASVGSPGRTKVYLLDEVHMLSPAASNALLKTLEEPPDHVTFVLATTDPEKVLPTIRSRTQHYRFSLLSAEELEEYVRWIVADAGLSVDDAAIAHVVRAGRGSARDTLSALDQVVAAGGVVERPAALEELVAAVGERDAGRAMVAVAEAIDQGGDPRIVGESLLGALRDAFLVTVGSPAGHLSGPDREAAGAVGAAVGAAGLTRALETLGGALVDMRQAADPRIPLEVALIRICDPTTDASVAALAERVEDLERAVARGAAVTGIASSPAASAASASASGPAPSRPVEAPTGIPAAGSKGPGAGPGAGAAGAAPAAAAPAPDIPPPPARPARRPAPGTQATSSPPAPEPLSASGLPTLEELTNAMADGVLARLKGVAKAIYTAGRFVEVRDDAAVFALANAATRDRAERVRADVEAALAQQFGRPVPLVLVDETDPAGTGAGAPAARRARPAAPPPPPTPAAPASAPAAPGSATASSTQRTRPSRPAPRPERAAPPPPVDAAPVVRDLDEAVDVTELVDATDIAATGADRIAQAFPGAVVLEEEQS
jgi:DNA polymerase-3 subunit gamma/tau